MTFRHSFFKKANSTQTTSLPETKHKLPKKWLVPPPQKKKVPTVAWYKHHLYEGYITSKQKQTSLDAWNGFVSFNVPLVVG